jgi:uncharacterized delta-60 repeat protein
MTWLGLPDRAKRQRGIGLRFLHYVWLGSCLFGCELQPNYAFVTLLGESVHVSDAVTVRYGTPLSEGGLKSSSIQGSAVTDEATGMLSWTFTIVGASRATDLRFDLVDASGNALARGFGRVAFLSNPSTPHTVQMLALCKDDQSTGLGCAMIGGNGACNDTGECVESRCGDGILDPRQEQCDDGNQIQTDACLNTCRTATCGDGHTCRDSSCMDTEGGVESCDTANENCANCSCASGYENSATPTATDCIDIDECANVDCGPGGVCSHAAGETTPNEYTCTECAPGYEALNDGVNTACTDIDECADANCGPGGVCIHAAGETTPNKYTCTECSPGYAALNDGVNTACTDIDECADANCGPGGTCDEIDGQPTSGLYTCSCAAGYKALNDGINTACTDIDECADANCGPGGVCSHAIGETTLDKYTCTECSPGYAALNDGINTACTDIDECADANCGSGGTCSEADGEQTPGRYTCACATGYEGGGHNTECTDIDECIGVDCGPGGNCSHDEGEQTPDRYTCQCDVGYKDGGVEAQCTQDVDTDEDGVFDSPDACAQGVTDWVSSPETDHDGDGCKDDDAEDPDDDNDGVQDGDDSCAQGVTDWVSSPETDHDGDGCKDDDAEDPDDDNDGVQDGDDSCVQGITGWTSNAGTDHDGDGCKDDDAEDSDDDNDGVQDGDDSCERGTTDWFSTSETDHDADGCQDLVVQSCDFFLGCQTEQGEDSDDDNDGVLDGSDGCSRPVGIRDWLSNSETDHDGDGCKDDSPEDNDDDNDGVLDGSDGCSRGASTGVDTDGDGCKDDGEDCVDSDPNLTSLVCGDGIVCEDEACDDGNEVNDGDACNNQCLVQPGFACSAMADCANGFCDLLMTVPSCQSPSLDATFNESGFDVLDLLGVTPGLSDSLSESANDVALNASTGDIVVVGRQATRQISVYDNDTAVVVYKSNGDLNTDFDSDGMKSFEFVNGHWSVANAVTIQSNDKIVVGGDVTRFVGSSEGGYVPRIDWALARLNTDGTFDTTFDADGHRQDFFATYDNNGRDAAIEDIAMQGDFIVAVGYSKVTAAQPRLSLGRFTSTGAPDESFGTDGFTHLDSYLGSYGKAMAFDSNGKILVTGEHGDDNDKDLFVARFLANGVLDTTFDTDGIAIYDPGEGSFAAGLGLAVSGNNFIVAVGYQSDGSEENTLLVAFDETGAPLNSFNGNGVVIQDLDCATPACNSASDRATDVLVLASGSIIITGHYGAAAAADASVQVAANLRYSTSGLIDPTFAGSDGDFIYTQSGGWVANASVLSADQSVVVVGSQKNTGSTLYDFMIYRLPTE